MGISCQENSYHNRKNVQKNKEIVTAGEILIVEIIGNEKSEH